MRSTTKTKVQVQEYLKNGLNGKKVIMKLEPEIKEATAEVKASRMLNSVKFKEELFKVMEEKGLKDEKVLTKHKKNIFQNKHLPSSNTAIDMYYKLKGSYAPEKKQSTNLNLDITLKELGEQLKELKEAE